MGEPAGVVERHNIERMGIGEGRVLLWRPQPEEQHLYSTLIRRPTLSSTPEHSCPRGTGQGQQAPSLIVRRGCRSYPQFAQHGRGGKGYGESA